MRLRQLFEASYDQMIISMKTKFPEDQQLIVENLKWAKTILKKDEKIVWWMRIVQASLNDTIDRQLGGYESSDLQRIRQDIEHYFGYQEQAIHDYQFGKQTVFQVLQGLAKIEDDILDNQERTQPVTPKQGDYALIEFPGDMAWWFVDRAYCPDEGRSGGHCGNVTGQHIKDQRILSFRKNGQVLLTFILETNGDLGEMKAKFNQKPQEKYHPYITSLLLHDFVKGIKGAGYLPEMNFSIFDLDENNIKKIEELKPKLITDQIIATPIEFLSAPDFIKQDSHYQMVAKQNLSGISELLNDNSLDSWTRAIQQNFKLVSQIPADYIDDFRYELVDLFIEDPSYLLKTTKAVLNDYDILAKVIRKRAGHIQYILQSNKHFVKLCCSNVYTFDHLENNVADNIKQQILNSSELQTILAANNSLYMAKDVLFDGDFDHSIKTYKFYYQFVKYGQAELYQIPQKYYDKQMCLAAVSHPFYVDTNEDNPLYRMPEEVVDNEILFAFIDNVTHPNVLKRIPDKYKTLDVCTYAVNVNRRNINDVPADIKSKLNVTLANDIVKEYYPSAYPRSEDELKYYLAKIMINLYEEIPEEKQQETIQQLLNDKTFDVGFFIDTIRLRLEKMKNES